MPSATAWPGPARPELTAEDVAVACWSLQGVADTTSGLPVNAWQRHVEVLLAGFATSHPCSPHAAEMDSVIRSAPKQLSGLLSWRVGCPAKVNRALKAVKRAETLTWHVYTKQRG